MKSGTKLGWIATDPCSYYLAKLDTVDAQLHPEQHQLSRLWYHTPKTIMRWPLPATMKWVQWQEQFASTRMPGD